MYSTKKSVCHHHCARPPGQMQIDLGPGCIFKVSDIQAETKAFIAEQQPEQHNMMVVFIMM